MVNENTTAKELFEEGYDITLDEGIAFRQHLKNDKCPKCGAYLITMNYEDAVVSCTECDFEK